jgi:hypothetical protein
MNVKFINEFTPISFIMKFELIFLVIIFSKAMSIISFIRTTLDTFHIELFGHSITLLISF